MGNIITPLWAECPALTRTLIVGYPALSLSMLILSKTAGGWMTELLFDCSVDGLQKFHLWSLFISAFYRDMLRGGMSFLMALFEIYMVMVQFPSREKKMGSTAFALWILAVNGLVHLVFLAFMYALSLTIEPSYVYNPSTGLWPLVLLILTLQLLADPQGSTSFWGLAQIPNKWYPIALVSIFCLINGMRILWDFVAALVVGYGYDYLRLDRFMPSAVYGGRIELRCGCCRRGHFQLLGASWVPATATPGFGADAADRRYETLSDFGRTSGQQLTAQGRSVEPGRSGGAGFEAFSGPGNALGDGSGDAQQPPLQPQQLLQQPPSVAPSPASHQPAAETSAVESAAGAPQQQHQPPVQEQELQAVRPSTAAEGGEP